MDWAAERRTAQYRRGETMKRIVAGVGLTLGLAAVSGRADDVYWAPVAPRTLPAPPVNTVPPPVVPAGATSVYRFQSAPNQSLTQVGVANASGWVRIPALGSEEPSSEPPIRLATATPPRQIPVLAPIADAVGEPKTETAKELPSGPANESTVPPAAPAAPQAAEPVTQIALEPIVASAPRLQVTAEYLLWWAKGSPVPPLLTTSPPDGANGIPGTLPGSTILISGNDLDGSTLNGARFGVTWWCDNCASYGFDGRYFFTGQRTTTITVPSLQADGTDISLFRPFFTPNFFQFGTTILPGPFREQVTANGVASGSFTARESSYFWGAEANYRDCIWSWCNCSSMFRADMLVGFRYLHLDEDLLMTENAIRLTQSVNFPDEVAGTRIFLFDEFRTKNDFYGGQIGTKMTYTRGPWSADLRGTVAVGNTTQTVTVDGGQVRGPLANGGVFVAQGGLLALNTNIGTRSRNEFSVVPEVGINVGYQMTDHWKAFVGYNFLYWSNVVRPADQIDTTIDVTRIPRFVPPGVPVQPDGPRPAPLFQSSDFWAQGVNFGVEYRW
jgi:hypothetical protein